MNEEMINEKFENLRNAVENVDRAFNSLMHETAKSNHLLPYNIIKNVRYQKNKHLFRLRMVFYELEEFRTQRILRKIKKDIKQQEKEEKKWITKYIAFLMM